MLLILLGLVLPFAPSGVKAITIRKGTMKRSLLAILLATAVTTALAADVGISISVGQPGFYGQIDIGNAPRPVLIYPQPVVIQRVQVVEAVQPIYLHVPPGHAKNWKKHCQKYDACARPVYFVKDDWYNNVYVPHYEQEHGKGKGQGKGKGK
jgi:hypothetical protein